MINQEFTYEEILEKIISLNKVLENIKKTEEEYLIIKNEIQKHIKLLKKVSKNEEELLLEHNYPKVEEEKNLRNFENP